MHAAGTEGGGCWEKVGEGLPEGPWDLSRTDALFMVDSVYSDTSEFSNLLPEEVLPAARATSRGCAWTDDKGDGGGSPQGPAGAPWVVLTLQRSLGSWSSPHAQAAGPWPALPGHSGARSVPLSGLGPGGTFLCLSDFRWN